MAIPNAEQFRKSLMENKCPYCGAPLKDNTCPETQMRFGQDTRRIWGVKKE